MRHDDPHVELRAVGKRFAGVVALSDVDLRVHRGTVHALVGENGAGKSTLGKLVAGVHSPSSGTLLVDGRPVRYRSPSDALADGITIVQQEVALIPQRTVLENVSLGLPGRRLGIARRRAERDRFDRLAERLDFREDPATRVGALRVPQQQQVEILRAIARGARLIVFDEPTASLTGAESARLRAVIRELRESGTTIIFVSHDLDEVLELADEVTVMRDGAVVRTHAGGRETKATLVNAMLGREATVAFPPKAPPPADAPVVLRARGLTRLGIIDDIDLDVRAGEIVALAGLVGSGRSEVARALFGADRVDAGAVEVDGRRVTLGSPRAAVDAGIALLPESRKEQGLLMLRPPRENVTLAHLREVSRAGVVDRRVEERETRERLEHVAMKGDPAAPVTTLSGGNQQKVLFAKWLFRRPRLLIADEPTRGVDIGAKLEIYSILADFAADGHGVLLISSEMEEVLGLAHRVLVMRRGRIVDELVGAGLSEERVLHAAFDAADPVAVGAGG